MSETAVVVAPGRLTRALDDRVPTGQGTPEKVGEFEWSGKGQGKIFFWKSQGK